MKIIKYLLLLALLAFCTNSLYSQPTIPTGAETISKGLYNSHHNPGNGHYQHHGGYSQNHGQRPPHHGQPPQHHGQRPQHHGQYHNGNHSNYHHHHHNNDYDDDDDEEYDDDDEEYDDDDDEEYDDDEDEGDYYDDDDSYDDDDNQQYSDDNSNQSNDNNNNTSVSDNSDNSNVDLNLGAIKDPMVRQAVEYLNAVRSNPGAYSKEIGVDLSNVKALHPLRWNEALARAAQAKAQDMADRLYLAHVDPDGYGMNFKINAEGYSLQENWYDDKSKNNFESCASNWATEGKSTIIQLIYDGGATDENAGHRIHLLGMHSFWSDCYDIGIGYAKESGGKGKWSVLIAKHHFNQEPYSDK